MNRIIEKIIEILKVNKKKIISGISILGVGAIGLGIVGTIFLYNNINYTEEQAKEIALKLVPGEVVKIRKDLELENLTFEYVIGIKDGNNMLREVTVDASLGVITDLDYYD